MRELIGRAIAVVQVPDSKYTSIIQFQLLTFGEESNVLSFQFSASPYWARIHGIVGVDNLLFGLVESVDLVGRYDDEGSKEVWRISTPRGNCFICIRVGPSRAKFKCHNIIPADMAWREITEDYHV